MIGEACNLINNNNCSLCRSEINSTYALCAEETLFITGWNQQNETNSFVSDSSVFQAYDSNIFLYYCFFSLFLSQNLYESIGRSGSHLAPFLVQRRQVSFNFILVYRNIKSKRDLTNKPNFGQCSVEECTIFLVKQADL